MNAVEDQKAMSAVNLVFPHQLFAESPLLKNENDFIVIEEFLFFKQFAFHKQKIAFHRASMKSYAALLEKEGKKVRYVDAHEEDADIRTLLKRLEFEKLQTICYVEPTDDWLGRRLKNTSLKREVHATQLFLNQREDLAVYFERPLKRFHQNDFYVQQRKARKILLGEGLKPLGGKWSYDAENRKKYPRGKTAPAVTFPKGDKHWKEAVEYVNKGFSKNPGSVEKDPLYPINPKQAKQWFNAFLTTRFSAFGPYEDAIVKEELILHHSVLTPMLNVGLLSPNYVLDESLSYAAKHEIDLNTIEGFVRQVAGWREFIRAVYAYKGREERTCNFWGFTRKIPASFYDGTTGITPIDITIKKVLKTGYCHHIERLMVLGNFMLLCEFDPDEVYRWFMELFIDAYDWVMVPNVYGMSQFADGGMMSTKPYISGSNYLMKMSNYKKGKWQDTWDGLFWRFMHVHRDFFLSNPRLGMLVRSFDKMDENKRTNHLSNANNFLATLV